jgi:hypothetical protein
MKIQTLFDDYLDNSVLVSLNGSPLYTQHADILKPYLEYDVKSICPLHRGRTAYLGISTKQPIDPEDLKLKLL